MSSTSLSSSTTTSTSSATPSCISVIPDKNGYVPEWACNSNYNYYPSFAAALIFAILFGITTLLHIYQAFTHKKLRLCWTLIMGTGWELASFIIRTLGTKNQQNSAFATVSQILVLLAPMWINAFDYMLLGRMVYFFVPEQKIWRIKGIKIAKIFVWLDVLSFLTQLGGGVLIEPGNSESTQMLGIHLYMGGIGLQQFCILMFLSIAIKFHLIMNQRERTPQVLDGKPRNWRALHYILYASLALISTRIIFRLIEFASGLDPAKNPIPYHEAYFMCLDALPMFIAIALMNIVHPGSVLQGEGSEFPKGPTRKEKKAAKRAKKEAKKALKEERKMMKKNGTFIEMV
ncbi:hypothetical protein N431DRAFT_432526 [Stipitochalara longipes BDJ]|nr:hypothetical protein N431DRAFT_432526 [Stipitochalara longipes BDJ]